MLLRDLQHHYHYHHAWCLGVPCCPPPECHLGSCRLTQPPAVPLLSALVHQGGCPFWFCNLAFVSMAAQCRPCIAPAWHAALCSLRPHPGFQVPPWPCSVDMQVASAGPAGMPGSQWVPNDANNLVFGNLSDKSRWLARFIVTQSESQPVCPCVGGQKGAFCWQSLVSCS